MGIADRIAITMMVIAKNFAMVVGPLVTTTHDSTSLRNSGGEIPLRRRCVSVRFRLEREVDGLRLVAGDGDIGGLGAVVLMPGGDGVLAGRQVGQLEVATIFTNVVVVGF